MEKTEAPELTLTLSRKQNTAKSLLDDPQVVEIELGGAAGGGKSFFVCIWMLIEARKYPGIRFGLGRKELKRLKSSTVVTLLSKVHPLFGITRAHFNYNSQEGSITYINGSQIQLVDLVFEPSDPDYDKFGSSEYTHIVIEEAGEVAEKAKTVFSSRKNRFLNEEYKIVGKTVLTGNPSQNFTRKDFYEPYKALGGGDYQKWPFGEVDVWGDKKLTAYRAFIKSLPTDNPFISKNYLETLRNLPPQERKRLFEGNWDYLDDDDMLFKSILLDRATIGERRQGKKFIGVDAADKGKDKTMASLVEDGILVEQQRLQVNVEGEKAISEAYALELIKFAQTRGFTANNARDIAIEGNGVGVGMRDFMRSKGWFITEYTATSQGRSDAYYQMSQDMDLGKFQMWSELPTLGELRKQLMTLTFDFKEDLKPKVIEKKKVKEVLGYSPDESDSAYIANWIRNGGNKVENDQSRLSF